MDQALAKDPEARYQDLSIMRSDLQRVGLRFGTTSAQSAGRVSTDGAETVEIQPPTPSPRRAPTPHRGGQREDLARRRATQVAAHLEHAQQVLAKGDCELAIASAEQALLLDPEEPEALDIIGRAKAVLEERQLQQLLNCGEELLRSGFLTEAHKVAEQAITLDSSPLAVTFQEAVAEALQVRARERLEQEALDRRAAAAVVEAEAAFEGGRHQDALSALEWFEPRHEAVTIALTRLREEKARIEEERRDAQERAKGTAAALVSAQSTASHEVAIKILEDALRRDPEHAELLALLTQRRTAWGEELGRARERREQVERGIDTAKQTASHEEAIAHLQQALGLEPAHAEAERLLTERRAALEREREEQRRAAERAMAIAAALAEAEATIGHEAAIAILRRAAALDPSHRRVQEQLVAREAALAHEREEARKAEERRKRVDAAVKEAKRADSHARAISTLEEALRTDPGHPELEAMLRRRQAEQDEERRQAEERRRQVAAEVTGAEAAPSHEAAIERLERALALAPSDSRVESQLRQRRAALEAEREAARQAEKREARLTAAIARATATDSHEKAVVILERALQVDGADSRLQTLLADRTAARDRQREEIRQRKEREQQVAAAVKQTRRTASHEAALAILAEALSLDPDHHEARALQAAREAALEDERAEAKRLAEIGSVRETIGGLIEREQFDEAAAAIQDAKLALRVGKTLRDLERRLATARAAHARLKPASPVAEAAPRWDRRLRLPHPVLAAAAAVTVIIIMITVAWLATGGGPSGGKSSESPSANAPQSAATQDRREQPSASPPASPPDRPSEPTVAAPSPAALAVQEGQQQIASGDLRQAFSTITGGLQSEPDNPELRKLLGEMLAKSRQQATTARASAARHGAAATELSAFRDGSSKFNQAAKHARTGQPEQAVPLYWEAAALFDKAELDAREALAQAAEAAPESSCPGDQPRLLPTEKEPKPPSAAAATSTPPTPGPPASTLPAAPAAAAPAFSFDDIRVLVFDGRDRAREREGVLQLGGGQVTIVDSAGNRIAVLPYKSIAGAFFSRSKQPRWRDAHGKEVESKVDLGRMSFLRGERNWVIFLSDSEPLIIRLDDKDLKAVLSAIEEQTGTAIKR